MNLTSLRYRIKDSTSSKHLNKMAGSVNYVWNYCNEVNQECWSKFRKTYSGYDLNNMTTGCSIQLGLQAKSIQSVCEEYAQKCKQFKRIRLSWRSRKRSLGWIPFKGASIKVEQDRLTYNKHNFRIWLSRPIEGLVKCGSFNQDAQGHWYVNLVIEEADKGRIKTGKLVGIDLGLKTLATLSDGVSLSRNNLTKQFEDQLAMAQRARKKKRVTKIHARIRNKRKDWNHKTTTRLVRDYDRIVVGNVSSSKLMKTRMAKSVTDASWSDFKRMLDYKAVSLGIEVKVVNESYSTVTCSDCSARSGPSGLSGLGVRDWVCSSCGSVHDRDVNAAKNILRSGH